MKIVVEKTEAVAIQFNPEKEYIVLNDFKNSEPIGVAVISIENGIMYADIKLKENAQGYPAIAYDKRGSEKYLFAIGICESPNLDGSIEKIEYKLN